MIKKLIALVYILTVVINAASIDEVRKGIDNILSNLPSGTRAGIIVFNPLTQDTIYALNHMQSMIPASNTKLFTTVTALSLMSGDYLLSTKLYTDDTDLSDGVINGNLYLKGFGNSLFTTEDIEKMVDSLRQIGITRITGSVFGDDTYFDDIYTRDDWIKDEKANVTLPPVSAIVLDRNRTVVRKKKRGRYRNYLVNIENPPLTAAKKLKEILEENSINVEGSAGSGVVPAGTNLIISSQIELRELISAINKHSDNFLAECLFKTIGAFFSGEQGNSFYATQAILTFIKDNGIYSDGTAIVDGSGISRFDQVTTGAVAGLLERIYFDINGFDDFYNSLSIAGVDGTLGERMIGTSAQNNFRGKTGTLNGVSSVSGYLTTDSGDDLIVSIIFEFEKGRWNTYRDIQDDIIVLLAGLNEENPDELIHRGPDSESK